MQKRKREETCGLPLRQKLVVVAACVLSDYDLFLAAAVGSMLQQQVMGPKERAAFPPKVPVRDWFRTVDLDSAEAIYEPRSKKDASVRADALRWVAEVRTMYWIRDENFNRELPPASDSAALQYVQQMTSLDESRPRSEIARACQFTFEGSPACRAQVVREISKEVACHPEQARSAGWFARACPGCTSPGLIVYPISSASSKAFKYGTTKAHWTPCVCNWNS